MCNDRPCSAEVLLDTATDTALAHITDLEAAIRRQEEELVTLGAARAQADQENAALRATVDRLEKTLQERDAEASRLEQALQSHAKKTSERSSEVARLRRELAQVKENGAELVDQARCLRTNLENEGPRELERARQRKAEIERARAGMQALFGRQSFFSPIQESDLIEERPQKKGWQRWIVTVEKELEEARESWRVLNGQLRELLAELEQSKETERDLRAKLSHVVAERDELAERLREANSKLARLEKEVAVQADDIAGLLIDKANLEADLQAMRDRADSLGQEAENLEAVLEQQYHSAAELVLQRDEARGQRNKAAAKLRALEEKTGPVAELLATLQDLYGVNNAKEVEEAARQDKRELAGLSEELELAHRDLEKKDRLVDQLRKAAAENRRQLEVVTADRDEKTSALERSMAAQDLLHQLEQAKARATAATVEVGQLITQRVELVERAKSVAQSAGLPAPTDLKGVEKFLVGLAADRNEARNALEAQVQGLAADRDRLLRVGRELAERFPGNPPENLQELAGLLSEVVAKKEETAGVLDGYRVLSRRRDLVLEAGRELARAHGEEPPEDLEELAALLGQLARQESSDGLPGREALLKETREQRETLHALAHEVDQTKALADKRELETAEEVATVETLKKRLANQTDHLERLQAELASLGEIFRQLQELYDVTSRTAVLAKAQAERNEVDTLRRELSETLAEVEDLKERLADQKEATEVAEHDGGLDMERVAELERQLAEKDKVLATLQGFYEVSKWTELPEASAILHSRFGEIVQERDQLRRERTDLSQARGHYLQERDELAQRLRTQAAAKKDRQELDYLRGELRLVRSALLTALGREAEDNDEPVVPAQLRDLVVTLRSNRDHHRARDVRLSRELDEKHFDATANDDRGAEFFRGLAATIRDERDRLKEDKDQLQEAMRDIQQFLVFHLGYKFVEIPPKDGWAPTREEVRELIDALGYQRDQAKDFQARLTEDRDRLKEDRDRLLQEERKALAQVESLERDLEAEVAQRAALKIERNHLARELSDATAGHAQAASEGQELSAHLDAALAEMERLSGRFLESEAERYELWAERMSWSTESAKLLGQVKDLERELAEVRSASKQALQELERAETDYGQEADEVEVLFHSLTRICLADVDIVRDSLERCGCLFCAETVRRLMKAGYLPAFRGTRKLQEGETDDYED